MSSSGQQVPHFATELLDNRTSDADAVDDEQRGLVDAILIADQLPDVRKLDPHPNDLEEVEHLAALPVPRKPELGADSPVAAALRPREVPAVDDQLVMRALLKAPEAIDRANAGTAELRVLLVLSLEDLLRQAAPNVVDRLRGGPPGAQQIARPAQPIVVTGAISAGELLDRDERQGDVEP